MPSSNDQEGSAPPKETERELDDCRWSYPEGFDAALRQLYERSFEECDLSPEVQFAVLDAFRSLGVAAANLTWHSWDAKPSIHTAEMWAAGRLDLTAASLVLSDVWRVHLPPRSIEQVETRLAAFAYLSTQQALVEAGSGAPGPADRRLEDAGYRVRILDKRAFLVLEPIPRTTGHLLEGDLFERGCDPVLEVERNLRRVPFLQYDIGAHHHLLFCASCQKEAPIAGALFAFIAGGQLQRMRLFLANLVECLNFSESKLEKMGVALHNPEQDSATLMNAAIWRPFLLANYLLYVADMFAYCAKPGTYNSMVNVWTALMNGEGHPEAIRFVRSLTKQEFEAALFAHEIFAATEDYPDVFAFRWMDSPITKLVIPALGEELQSIPGFLEVQDAVRIEDWAAFLERSRPEEIPWWGYDAIRTIIKLAARSARLALVESGLAARVKHFETPGIRIY
jgi:hypothetical protein